MAKIYSSITELVGRTPIVEFKRLENVLGLKGRVAGKLIVPLLPDNGERYLSENLQRVRPEIENKVGF